MAFETIFTLKKDLSIESCIISCMSWWKPVVNGSRVTTSSARFSHRSVVSITLFKSLSSRWFLYIRSKTLVYTNLSLFFWLGKSSFGKKIDRQANTCRKNRFVMDKSRSLASFS